MTSQLARAKPVIDELRIAMRKPLSGLSKPWWYLICAAVFFFALALRIAHSTRGLPYVEDDTEVYANSLYMNRRDSLDPIRFNYPSLIFMYGYFMNKFGVFLANLQGGDLRSENLQWGLEGWEALISNPSIYFLNRAGLSVLGTFTCVITIAIATNMVGRLAGIAAGLTYASVFIAVTFDTAVNVTGPSTFFVAATILLSLSVYTRVDAVSLPLLLSAFATAGLAAGSKYQAGAVVFSVVIALWVRRPENLLLKARYTAVGLLCSLAAFLVTTPFAVVRPQVFFRFLMDQRNIYFKEGVYGANVEAGVSHLFAIISAFYANLGGALAILAALGILYVILTAPKSALVVFFPLGIMTAYMSTSIVNRHFSHSITYPVLAVGVGAGVSFFVGLWLVARQRKWRGSSLLAVPMVAVFVPVGLAVAGGFQQIVTDWRYQDPRVEAIDALATGQYGGTIVFATELRVHPAERERLSGVASAQVLPLEQIVACDFSPDTTLVLPTSVTTWREAAARSIGEIKPPNELNASLQQLLANANSAAKFGTNETVLDYNFTDPEVIIVRATDISSCA